MADKADNESRGGAKKIAREPRPKKVNGKNGKVKNRGGGEDGKGGAVGGIVFAAVSLLAALFIITVVLGAALFFTINRNFLGVTDTYRDQIRDIPILSWALPREINPDDPGALSRDDLLLAYRDLEAERDGALSELATAEADRDTARADAAAMRTYKDQADEQKLTYENNQREINDQRAALDAERKAFEDLKYEAERAAAEGDPEGFRAYFEGTSPEVAQEIYAQIVTQTQETEDTKAFAKLYEEMDAKSAAAIFEQMGDGRIDLIVTTLKGMKSDSATAIIASMTPEFAASVSVRMAAA